MNIVTKIIKKFFKKPWVKAASIRALKTVSQTATGMITVGAAVYEINWLYIVSVSLTAGLISILTSINGLPELKE